ncbi:MAG: GNAT family N-acetyltransferase [Chloroflexi bacterium]|nr:MAG: GNAT family N-acetyltransferase [Chloroflexota bacterium]
MVAPVVPDVARFSPPVPGIVFRGFAGIDADIPGMAEVARRARLASGEIEPVDEAAMRTSYAHLERSDPARDVLVAELEGEIVGYSRVEWGDTNDGERYYDGFCFLGPEARRRGIGRAMLAWNEARRRAIAADHVAAGHGLDRPRWLTTFAFDGDPGAAVLLRSAGYAPFRRFYSMVRPDLEAIPDAPLPEGIEIRPIARDRLAMRQVFDADSEAFRDHFGWVSGSDDAFAAFVEDPSTDPSLWLVGFDGDDVAGAVLNGIHGGIDGRPAEGWLDSVFTRRPWRRRGLARALIVRSLFLLREHGLTSASLGVDAQNPNQALHLYESCGFRVASSSTAYRKPVADEPPEDRRGIR